MELFIAQKQGRRLWLNLDWLTETAGEISAIVKLLTFEISLLQVDVTDFYRFLFSTDFLRVSSTHS